MTSTQMKTIMGPLWKLFSNENVHEFCIDSFDYVSWAIWNKKDIKMESDKKLFKSETEYLAFVKRLIKASGQAAGNSTYVFTLDEFTHVNIVLPPIAIKGPAVNIIKMYNQNFNLDDLVKWKAIDEKGKKLLEDHIKSYKGILVAGGMGSGKTTLLNILLNSIPLLQRVVTLEHSGELMIYRDNVCRLKTPTSDPKEMVDVIRCAGRMRACWLVMSYLNGPEVMPFIELLRSTAMGMGCITGENVFDALKRLETKALISSEGLTLEDVRYAIAQAFPLVMVQERRADGKRVVSQIAEVTYEAGELKVKILHKM